MILDVDKIREDFPILRRKVNGHELVYFDNAATSQKPRQVIEIMRDFYEKHNANVHRAVHTLSQEASEMYEEAHEEVARFINASMEETVFVRGTTEAINLVAYAWGLHQLKKGDEVLISLMEHHSNLVPWEILSKIRNFTIKYIDVRKDGTLDYASFEDSISRRTRLVCVSHVSNVTGIINDVKRLTKTAHEHGALTLVDGAQSVPHMPVDMKKLDVDFAAFSGHKMLGPTGIGVLYGKQEILEKMAPFHGGGEMIREVAYSEKTRRCETKWNTLPWKFEAGTPNVEGAVGLAEAIRYLNRLGMENVKQHEEALIKYALPQMEKRCSRVNVYGTKDASLKCGIIPFGIEGLTSHDVALFLDNFGIMIRSGFHCAQPLHETLKLASSARASFYIYNTKEEVDKFTDALREVGQF